MNIHIPYLPSKVKTYSINFLLYCILMYAFRWVEAGGARVVPVIVGKQRQYYQKVGTVAKDRVQKFYIYEHIIYRNYTGTFISNFNRYTGVSQKNALIGFLTLKSQQKV